ncbi:hypothetical protein JXO59_04830 [candidate division KSB1 bacterium]|nr:hypothetical protein [candidate division KSB1 bacterium]
MTIIITFFLVTTIPWQRLPDALRRMSSGARCIYNFVTLHIPPQSGKRAFAENAKQSTHGKGGLVVSYKVIRRRVE